MLTVAAHSFNCTIDRLVNAPAHGKQIVDVMNAVCKRYIKDCMRRITSPDDKDAELCNKFNSWLHDQNQKNDCSLAEQCVRLCNDKDRKNGVHCAGNKYRKRESEKKFKERHYFNTRAEECKYDGMKFDTVQLKNISSDPGTKLKHTGTHTRYNFRADFELGIGYIAVRRLSCWCSSCVDQLKIEWDPTKDRYNQPRYARNENCALWNIFEGENDWQVAETFVKGGEEEF